MSFDPQAHRQASLDSWEAAASGWVRQQDRMRSFAAPVSHWLIDALALQPGQRVLELASGIAETGLLAAELVAPGGSVIISDQAEAMLDGARARAEQLGIANVEFKVLNAEWIDLPVASVDAVLCRWGYMLMADPVAALGETRRVLSPGGSVALSVWDAIEHNPWAAVPARELIERGIVPPPQRPSAEQSAAADGPFAGGAPGPFAIADRERLAKLLDDAGFTDVQIDAVELTRREHSFDAMWQSTLDISPSFHNAVMSQPAGEVDEIRSGLQARLEPFTAADGTLALPGRALVASASA